MKGNPKKSSQQSFLYHGLAETLNPRNPLYQLAENIPWELFEKEFSTLYIDFGRPAKPIRLMTSLLILKQLHDLSDEQVVRRWVENPYWQFFSGESEFQWNFPCNPSELTYFRKRIGEKGAEKIFEVSIKMHGRKALEEEVIPDTTVQEKNITYPTDTKNHIKVIKFCWRVAEKEGIQLRQSYRRTIPKLMFMTRYRNSVRRKKEAAGAARKIKIRAGRLVRDIERKLSPEALELYRSQLDTAKRLLEQKKNDKDKVYSFHEPEVSCIAKGKEHKKYEFGSKVSILLTKNSGVIVGAMNFQGNPYDGNTLAPQLEQYKKFFGKEPKAAIVDEGYRGRKKIGDTMILRVHRQQDANYSRWRWKQRFRRRASVEAAIGHLKSEFRMARNYLKGVEGDIKNLYLSCAAYNFKKLMRELAFYMQKLIAAIRELMAHHNKLAFDVI